MIDIQHLNVQAGAFQLGNISFRIETGEYAALMGRTGSGKTTLLEALCGLRKVHSGRILLDGVDVTWLPPSERGIGYVPQDRALFQTMTVRDNLAFALEVRKSDPQTIENRVRELSELLGITALLHRKPQGLSGGESQRVALGRALAFHPAILCLDEPLSALDEETREEMYELLESVRRATHVTILHITHHRNEAERLADRIFHIKDRSLVEQSNIHDRDAQAPASKAATPSHDPEAR